jgi:hypothetical protein
VILVGFWTVGADRWPAGGSDLFLLNNKNKDVILTGK